MSASDPSRRDFLASSGVLLGGTWFAFHHPGVLRAALHARDAMALGSTALEVLTPNEATELEAIASQIFPSDETPGAREAGVIHFMDRAFGTFASNLLVPVRAGLNELRATVTDRFAGQSRFSALSDVRQIAVLKEIEVTPFFGAVRNLTVMGMFADPSHGGNRDRVGWTLIGFDGQFAHRPPFGYYDRQYTDQPRGDEE